MGLLTDETQAMPYDDLYALATPKQPFNMLFNMSNILRTPAGPRVPGGSLFIYRNGDRGAWEFLEKSDEEVEREWVDALTGLFPDLRGHVKETMILRMPRSLPYPSPGYDRVLHTLAKPLGRIHLAGDYLGGSYTETAIGSGRRPRSPCGRRCRPRAFRSAEHHRAAGASCRRGVRRRAPRSG